MPSAPAPTRSGARTTRSIAVPTGWFAAAVAAAAVPLAIVRADRWIVLAGVLALVAAIGALDALAAVPPQRIEVRREFPVTLTIGQEAELRWLVHNTSERPVRVTVADALWPSLDASRRRASFRLTPGGRHRFGARIRPSRRGRFPFGALTVRTLGPMRLFARQQTRDVVGTLAVMPAYPSRDEMRPRLKVPLESGVRSVRTRGTGTEFDQLREYRPGDDVRRVDWAATARRQNVVVRDYRAERNQHVVALLDNGRVMAGTVGASPRVEHAMDAVLALTQVATHLGDNVGLMTFDDQVRSIVPPRNARAQFGRVAEAMYLLEPQLDETAYRPAFMLAAAKFRRRTLFVVFTDLVESVVADSLLPALATLTRTHLVMVAAVRDPDVAAWATEAGHQVPSAAYRSAAAVASLESRDRTVARLRAAGAVVVDAAPGRLAVDVVDTYLDLKTRGQL